MEVIRVPPADLRAQPVVCVPQVGSSCFMATIVNNFTVITDRTRLGKGAKCCSWQGRVGGTGFSCNLIMVPKT